MCIGIDWSIRLLTFDFFYSDSMGTRGIGTGNKCILSIFGKRNTAAGGPTFRVRLSTQDNEENLAAEEALFAMLGADSDAEDGPFGGGVDAEAPTPPA